MDFSPSNPVTLVVKAPNQQIADQTIECALGWTVKKLKEHLSSVYPSKPREKEQKLIYSGKLLQDHLMLRDVLRQYGDETQHTLHLVCSPSTDRPKMNTERQNLKSPSPPASQPEGLRRRHPESTPVSSSTPPSQPQQYQGFDEQTAARWNQYLSQMGQQAHMGNPHAAYMGHPGAAHMAHPAMGHPSTAHMAHPSMGHPGAAHMAHPAMGHPGAAHMAHPSMGHPGAAHMAHPSMGYMSYDPQQYLYMQQMYTQYMQQYMQYYQQTATGASPPPSPQPNLPQQQNAVNQPVNQRNPQQPANQNIRMNAQGGPVDDDDEDEFGQRDWLDWVYTFSRFGVLLSIVYFYSTMSRFIMVFLFFLVVYLYDRGFFSLRRREAPGAQAPVVPEAAAPEPVAEQQEEATPTDSSIDTSNETTENTENESQDTQESSENMGDNSETTVPEEPQPGALKICWCFISTFFTSLIPQPPPAVNAN